MGLLQEGHFLFIILFEHPVHTRWPFRHPWTTLSGSENLGNSWQMLQCRIDQSGHEEHGGWEEDDCEGGAEEDGDKLSSVSHEKE